MHVHEPTIAIICVSQRKYIPVCGAFAEPEYMALHKKWINGAQQWSKKVSLKLKVMKGYNLVKVWCSSSFVEFQQASPSAMINNKFTY